MFYKDLVTFLHHDISCFVVLLYDSERLLIHHETGFASSLRRGQIHHCAGFIHHCAGFIHHCANIHHCAGFDFPP